MVTSSESSAGDRETEIKRLLAQHEELAHQWAALLREEENIRSQDVERLLNIHARQLQKLEEANEAETRLVELGYKFPDKDTN